MTTTKTLPSGVLAQKNNFYALRILGSACEFTVDELTAVAALSQKFGGGQVTATSRGTLEINQIPAEKLDAAIAATQAAHLYLGGMMSKSPALGYTIERTFTREQIFSAVQIVLEKYRAHGDKGERLRHLFDRQPQVLEEIKQALQAL